MVVDVLIIIITLKINIIVRKLGCKYYKHSEYYTGIMITTKVI